MPEARKGPAFSLTLKGRAVRLLAAREHTRAELQARLMEHADSPEALQTVLDELTQTGLLSDERAVQSLLNRRAARYGSQRLKQELRQRGIEGELLRRTVSDMAATEVERAADVWRRKFNGLPHDARERARQTRFLAARGFGAEAIRTVLSQDPSDP